MSTTLTIAAATSASGGSVAEGPCGFLPRDPPSSRPLRFSYPTVQGDAAITQVRNLRCHRSLSTSTLRIDHVPNPMRETCVQAVYFYIFQYSDLPMNPKRFGHVASPSTTSTKMPSSLSFSSAMPRSTAVFLIPRLSNQLTARRLPPLSKSSQ